MSNSSLNPQSSTLNPSTRRDFLKSSTAAVVAGGIASQLAAPLPQVHAAGSDTLRLGLIGCGGRGSGAALQALTADANTKLVALGDVFADQLERSLANLKKTKAGDRVEVDQDHRFVGWDAYKQVIDSVDVVLLAAPPHFRPLHLKAAVDAGKHVFAEKPVAVDAPGIRSVLGTSEEARKKDLVLVSGLCWRYETNMQKTVQRIHEGGLGDIVALETTRYGGGVGKLAPRQPGWTDMQAQMRNWYYYTWLSGDFIVEQFVHELDKMSWVMKNEYPVSCTCTGGRQTRVGPEYGHIYDHFNAIFEYASGAKLYAGTRHQPGCSNVNLDLVHGTAGRCDLKKYTITGLNPWRLRDRATVMHQLEQDAFLAYIRAGEPHNDGEYMSKSSLLAIMARMSAYTGRTITWEQALNSTEDLSPPAYDWNVSLPEPPVAMPGVTQFA